MYSTSYKYIKQIVNITQLDFIKSKHKKQRYQQMNIIRIFWIAGKGKYVDKWLHNNTTE